MFVCLFFFVSSQQQMQLILKYIHFYCYCCFPFLLHKNNFDINTQNIINRTAIIEPTYIHTWVPNYTNLIHIKMKWKLIQFFIFFCMGCCCYCCCCCSLLKLKQKRILWRYSLNCKHLRCNVNVTVNMNVVAAESFKSSNNSRKTTVLAAAASS